MVPRVIGGGQDVAPASAYVAGTFDTKGRELLYLAACLTRAGLTTVTVDLSTTGGASAADVQPAEVAACHPGGTAAVFTGDRGTAVAAMALAFERFVEGRRDVGGLISAGGSGNASLAAPAMRRMPVGVPKVMVTTVASGDVRSYVGDADICMIYPVTDVSGINRISARILANAAHALAGMMLNEPEPVDAAKPAIGLTMFGVTTPCVQAVQARLEERFDCLIFHATGAGGRSFEKLVDSGLIAAALDITTTEIADLLCGGILSAGEDRLGAFIRTSVPYVGSVGALDMVNFGPRDSVPASLSGRNLYAHNPQVTLMRTTPDENAAIGRWIAERLNRMAGPVRFLLPLGGVSLIDAPGKPFHDPVADEALFAAIREVFEPGPNRLLVEHPAAINDPAFADALVDAFLDVVPSPRSAHAPLSA
jgi:uncharacterized protein (UPF0261 family)